MKITDLIKPIKAGIRSKLFICLGALLVGLTYCYVQNPWFKLGAIIAFFFLAEAMVAVWGYIFLQMGYENIRMIFTKKGLRRQYNNIKFTRLARDLKVKLNKKRPFEIQVGLNNAYSNYLNNRIVIGSTLFRKLNKGERLALAAHEMGHLKSGHSALLIFWVLIVPGTIYNMALFTSPPLIVSQLIFFAAFIITFVLISWRNEYSADALASKVAGVENTVSLLKKLAPSTRWGIESVTHPSIQDRINKLQKFKPI